MKKIVYCEGVMESWLTDSNDDEYDDEKTPYFEAGPFYLASDVDARIAELEKRIADLSKCDCGAILSRSCPVCDRDE